MRGIIAWGTYLPFRRLDRADIGKVLGRSGGRGSRTVASFDEDPTTMAVEAARSAMRTTPASPDLVLFCSVNPAYADRTNATAIHAALRLGDTAIAADLGLSTRSAVAGVLLASCGHGTTLVTAADIRVGLAGSAEEASGGDAASALIIGDESPDTPVLAEIMGTASRTAEFIDRWRTPGDTHSKIWDEKFSGVTLVPLAVAALTDACAAADITPAELIAVAVSAPTARMAKTVGGKLGVAHVVDDFAAVVGQCGAAQPGLMLAHLIEQASPGDVVALVSACDGADAVVFRVTDAAAGHDGAPTVAAQAAGGAPISYGRFLAWRGTIAVDPPRRPEPQRVSSTAAARNTDWKYGFVASVDEQTGAVHLPPLRVSADGERTDAMTVRPMADIGATIATFTVDHVAYSPSPPIVFAVVDFDGGGRLPVELCDCDADEVKIGARVEMTFRRLHAIDGMPNYFWKARLARG